MPETYKPTEAMAAAAKRGLKMRDSQPPSNRGGTAVGLARANQLVKREALSLDTVKRMYSFFSRHEVDKSSDSWKKGNSKGEQAWLLWGGDAGYTWSKNIVKKLEGNVSQNLERLEIVQAINAERVVDDGEYIIIKDVVPIIDDIVMNGGKYPASQIANTYQSLEGTIAPLGHPMIDGEYVSATNGEAMQKFYIGAYNRDVRYEGGRVLMNVKINKAQALAHPRGQELLDRITGRGEPIHVSTGVMLHRIAANGESGGKEYTWEARIESFDHNAILLDEPGAGTPADGIGMALNHFVIDQQEAEPEVNQSNLLAKVLDLLQKAVPAGYNTNTAKTVPNLEQTEMNEAEVKELIANALADQAKTLEANMDSKAKELQEKLDEANKKIADMKEKMAANAEAEHDKLVADAAEATGLEANHLKGMTDEGLREMIAKTKTSIGVNAGLPAGGADDYVSADYDLNSLMEDK